MYRRFCCFIHKVCHKQLSKFWLINITGGHKNVMPRSLSHFSYMCRWSYCPVSQSVNDGGNSEREWWREHDGGFLAWSRTQQYNVSIVMIHRFSVSVGPCMYSRYEFIAEELSLIDTYMYTCNKWSQLNQAHILIHICSIFSVLRNILKFKLLLSFF